MSKLQALRKAKGFNQQTLADAIGMNVSTIRSFEQGWRNINKAELSTILKLCNVLGCRIQELLDDDETLAELDKYEHPKGSELNP